MALYYFSFYQLTCWVVLLSSAYFLFKICRLILFQVQVGDLSSNESAALVKVVEFARNFLKSVEDFSGLSSRPQQE